MESEYFLNNNNSSIWRRLFILVGLVMCGVLLSAVPGFMLVELIPDKVYLERALQLAGSIIIFVLPAIVFVRIFGGEVCDGLLLSRATDRRLWLPLFLSMLLLQPSVNLIGFINSQMSFPEFMSPVEIWMRKMEEMARGQLLLFFDDASLPAVAANMLVMAVTAGFAEEVFFRGALMHALSGKSPAGHAAIWISAAIFSAIHVQFYGFLPRMLLGAYFGYLVCWSRSLWPAVFVHFANNALLVALSSIPSLKEMSVATGEVPKEEVGLYVLGSVLTLPLFAWCVKYVYGLCSRSEGAATSQSSR
jgi:membrane protease YdiL (CAAX protease family)